MLKDDRIVFIMGDFVKNAGLVGLFNLLQTAEAIENVDYGYNADGSGLWLDKSYALSRDWTDLYFSAMTTLLSENTTYARVMEKIDRVLFVLSSPDVEDLKEERKTLKEDLKYCNDKLLSNSYQSGFDSIRETLSSVQAYEDLRKEKLSEKIDRESLKTRLNALRSFLSQPMVKETFLMKSLAYTHINRFWDGKCFLLRANAKKNMRACFTKDFSEPLLTYWQTTHEKAKDSCIDCGNPVAGKERIPITFMTDMADDLTRKRSAFWNGDTDAYLCPECAFLYALTPLGFQRLGQKSLFFNTNSGIEDLLATNTATSKLSLDKDQKDGEKRSSWIARLSYLLLGSTSSRLENIQVILKSNDSKEHYLFQVINREACAIAKDNKAQDRLKILAEHPFCKLNGEFVNIYETVFFTILNRQDQYPLITSLLRASLVKGNASAGFYAEQVFFVQSRTERVREYLSKNFKGGSEVEKDKLVLAMYANGRNLRRELRRDGEKSEAFEERNKGFLYKLLNALSARNKELFLDLVMRSYITAGLLVPSEFMESFDEDRFRELGYAFTLGLKSE